MPETTLTEVEKAMQWERMSGERLPDAERARIDAGGTFHPPSSSSADHSQTTLDATADAVREYRDANACSIFEAQRQVTRAAALRAIEEARTVDDLKPLLRMMIRHLR